MGRRLKTADTSESSIRQRAYICSRIHKQHKELMEAVERRDVAAAVQIISLHLQESQRERLAEFDRHKREVSIRNSMPSFLEIFQPFVS